MWFLTFETCVRSQSFLKTGISNRMDGTEDDLLWDSKSGSEEEVESDVPADWDTDLDITQTEIEQLFDESETESDCEGF